MITTTSLPYTKYDNDQLNKIGNSVIYFSERIPKLSKTKLLKLLYILDEISIKKSGIPFLNLKYKVWKFGPVSEELFIELSSEATLLDKYIVREGEENGRKALLSHEVKKAVNSVYLCGSQNPQK